MLAYPSTLYWLIHRQQCARILLRVCGGRGTEVLEISDIPKFDNSELTAEFSRLDLWGIGKEPLASGPGETVIRPPPNKRRRVNEGPSVSDEIVADLTELLTSQKTTDVDGLHQYAE